MGSVRTVGVSTKVNVALKREEVLKAVVDILIALVDGGQKYALIRINAQGTVEVQLSDSETALTGHKDSQ